jgi:hypothetical protein
MEEMVVMVQVVGQEIVLHELAEAVEMVLTHQVIQVVVLVAVEMV